MRKISLDLILTGNTEEAYADVCDELVVEDFILRHWEDMPEANNVGIEVK